MSHEANKKRGGLSILPECFFCESILTLHADDKFDTYLCVFAFRLDPDLILVGIRRIVVSFLTVDILT